MTTATSWVGLGVDFGNQSMKAILSCEVPITLNTIWDSMYKLKTGGVAVYHEISPRYGTGDKEIVSTGRLLPHKDLLCSIEGNYMFTRSR